MPEKVLVTYGTRTGVTKEIAEAIAQAMEHHGATVTVLDASEAGSVAEFDLVVVGSPIYGGALRDEILTFFELHELELINKRVAMFTNGMLSALSPEQAKGEHEGALELAFLRAPGLRLTSHAIFEGAYFPEKVDFVSRKLMERKGAKVGDYRDWNAIRAWAIDLVEPAAA